MDCGICCRSILSLKGRFGKLTIFFFFSFLSTLSGLSTAKRKFADSLNEFKFQCIGDAETDDEMCIGEPADMKSLIQFNLCWLNVLK